MNISIEITGNLLEYLDSKVKLGSYKSRSEVVRTAIREMIQRDLENLLRAKGVTPESFAALRNSVAGEIVEQEYKELI